MSFKTEKLTPVQNEDFRRAKENKEWLQDNVQTNVMSVTLTLACNSKGTPMVQVSGPYIQTHEVMQPPDVYIAAVRRAYEDSEWSKNPKDDLGDLPTCESNETNILELANLAGKKELPPGVGPSMEKAKRFFLGTTRTNETGWKTSTGKLGVPIYVMRKLSKLPELRTKLEKETNFVWGLQVSDDQEIIYHCWLYSQYKKLELL